MEYDIVGLSITSVSAKSKYTTKFNVIRMHLTTMPDHPIVKLKDFFRVILKEYIQTRQQAIIENFAVFQMDSKNQAMAENYEILFQKVVKEIKSFIVLMHDAVIRFYKLEVKVGLQCSQNEHLTNLLTSLVLKNPIYSDVHGLIRHHHIQLRPK